MRLEVKKYLLDILNSIQSIHEYVGPTKDFQHFEANKLLKRAVEREFEIIGEAINKILKIEPAIQISHARRIVNLRNWIIHSYDNVDYVILWGIIQKDLPLLEVEIKHYV